MKMYSGEIKKKTIERKYCVRFICTIQKLHEFRCIYLVVNNISYSLKFFSIIVFSHISSVKLKTFHINFIAHFESLTKCDHGIIERKFYG